MKMVRHPNVVRLHEVLSSREKIYIVLEFVSGGELFDEIVRVLMIVFFIVFLKFGSSLLCMLFSFFSNNRWIL